MASVVAWGTSSVPASTVAVSAALGFAALWLLSVDLTSKRLPSYKYAFVGFAGVLVLAGWLGQGLTGDAAAMAAVLAGAAAVLASLLVQHTTTMLALTAAGCTAALAFSDALVEGQVVGPLGRSALLLFVGYLASRAEVSAMFGAGPTAYSLVVGSAVGGTFISFGGRTDVGVCGALLLLWLLVVSSDTRDHGAPTKGRVALAAVPAIIMTGIAFIQNGDALLAVSVPLALGLAVTLAAYANMPCPLGPWAHNERRAQSVLLVVFSMVFIDFGLSGQAAAVGQLLAFSFGFAVAAGAVAALALGVEVWNPYNATQHRLFALDLSVVVFMGIIGMSVVLCTSADAQAAVQAAVGAFAWADRATAAQYLDSHSLVGGLPRLAVLAGAALCLLVLAARLLQVMHRAVPGVSPLLAHMTHRGCITLPHVAITFNGAPRSHSELVALLQLLADKGAKGTFFFTGHEAASNVHAIDHITDAGHEVGVLGASGAPSTAFAVMDMEEAYSTILTATGKAPAWYRPADGIRDVALLRAANGMGMAGALWSVYPADWASTPSAVLAGVKDQIRFGGEILCLHLSEPDQVVPHPAVVPETLDIITATSAVFDALQEGISVVTMSALDPHQGTGTEVW